jgi:hypothetical protein
MGSICKNQKCSEKNEISRIKKNGESKCDVSYASGAFDKQMRL